jgi:hypothetical protein
VRCSACDAVHDLAAGARVGFRAVCSSCGADLHVCRNCLHHDPGAHNQCREPNTEWVTDRDRANFCDDFTPGEGGGGDAARAAGVARGDLEALFKKP